MTPGMPTGRGGVAGGIDPRTDCASVLMFPLAETCGVASVVYRCEED